MNPILTKINNDPMAMIKQIASTNQNCAHIAKLLENGANPESVFRNMCNERGINADQFLSGLMKR